MAKYTAVREGYKVKLYKGGKLSDYIGGANARAALFVVVVEHGIGPSLDAFFASRKGAEGHRQRWADDGKSAYVVEITEA